jgi:glutamate 5-kinase
MYTYDKLFTEYNHSVAQLLLTGEDLAEPARRANVERTLNRLLELGALPIINENDPVATDELDEVPSFGDNDTLASVVALTAHANLLILLSDIDGLYTADPHRNADAQLIPEVEWVTDELLAQAGGAGSSLGTGGMVTKLAAARRVTARGIPMVIVNGADPTCLYDVVAGVPVGTRFLAKEV